MKNTDFKFLTSDESVRDLNAYKAISNILSKMIRSGAFRLGTGYCISMSDMLKTALAHVDIDSKLVEVQTTLTVFDVDPPDVQFIGYPGEVQPGEIDTHVVVVTNTNPPFLIDASIQHRLPINTYAVVEPIPLRRDDHHQLINKKYDEYNISLTYTQKKKQSVPMMHHDSIVDRISLDNKFKRDIEYLKWLNYIGITISCFSLINVALKIFGYW